MLVRYKQSDDPAVHLAPWPKKILTRLQRKLDAKRVPKDRARYAVPLSKVEMFSDDRGAWGVEALDGFRKIDVLQLHWVAEFLNYRRFFPRVPAAIPIVWRLADMNPLTGGCHYDDGCNRYTQSCGACPKLDSSDPNDLSHAVWARKGQAFAPLSPNRLHLVALNRWMESQVRRSALFSRFDCTVIPNGVDLDEFYPLDQSVARKALGIPEGRRVVTFVAESVKNVRKGFPLLLEALNALAQRHALFLLAVGRPSSLPTDIPAMMLGPIQALPFLRQLYSAADVFVIPSLEDNQPNTVLEAMACGTPVAGFKVGGIPEMVESGETGMLAEGRSVANLAQAIDFLLSRDEERRRMAIRARQVVEQRFTRIGQVRQYSALYTRLLAAVSEESASPQTIVSPSSAPARNVSTPIRPEHSVS